MFKVISWHPSIHSFFILSPLLLHSGWCGCWNPPQLPWVKGRITPSCQFIAGSRRDKQTQISLIANLQFPVCLICMSLGWGKPEHLENSGQPPRRKAPAGLGIQPSSAGRVTTVFFVTVLYLFCLLGKWMLYIHIQMMRHQCTTVQDSLKSFDWINPRRCTL